MSSSQQGVCQSSHQTICRTRATTWLVLSKGVDKIQVSSSHNDHVHDRCGHFATMFFSFLSQSCSLFFSVTALRLQVLCAPANNRGPKVSAERDFDLEPAFVDLRAKADNIALYCLTAYARKQRVQLIVHLLPSGGSGETEAKRWRRWRTWSSAGWRLTGLMH